MKQPEGRPLGWKIKTIAKLMGQRMTNEIAPLELTSTQCFILHELCRRDGETIYARDLERKFGFRHPTVSGLLDRLEAKGFILRKPSETDRRCITLTATEKARRLDSQLREQIEAAEQNMLSGIPEDEIRTLHRCFDRMIENMKQEEGDHVPKTCPVCPRV